MKHHPAEVKLEHIRRLNANRQARWRARQADPQRQNRLTRAALRTLSEMYPDEYAELVAADRAANPGPATTRTYVRARCALRDRHPVEYAAAREAAKVEEADS